MTEEGADRNGGGDTYTRARARAEMLGSFRGGGEDEEDEVGRREKPRRSEKWGGGRVSDGGVRSRKGGVGAGCLF